jgi:hypothetical protein
MLRAIIATVALLLVVPGGAGAARGAGGAPDPGASSPAATAPPPGSTGGEGREMLLTRHAQTIERLRHSLEAVLGPLPAVATTPFFGLAALSAVAMAADTDLMRRSSNPVVRAVSDNDLVREAGRYAGWPVLVTLLALALITYFANSGKIRGVAGKGLRLIEDVSSFLLYSALATGALATAGPAAPPAATALRAMGLVDFSWDVLTACGLAIGLAAMMISRYALDFVIWLVPVPFIDFCFETLKKLLALGFIALYVFAPGAAAVLALLLAGSALLASGWALRMLGFAYHIVLRPWMAKLDPAFAPRLVEPRLLGRRAAAGSGPQLAAYAVALAAPGLRKRQGGTLVREGDGIWFVSRSWLGRRRRRPLAGLSRDRELVRTLLWTELRVTPSAEPGPEHGGPGSRPVRAGRAERFAISRALDFSQLSQLLDARDGGRAGASKLLYGTASPPAAAPLTGGG